LSKPKIVIVDYQAGNLRSVQKAIEAVGGDPVISSDAADVLSADGLVFPGQGANDPSMRALRERNLVQPIRAFIDSGKPFLGVCLGLQLLLEGSDEGSEPGFGVIGGRVRKLPGGQKIPHMGWNQVALSHQHPVFQGIENNSYFYFVHSYYADPVDRDIVAGTTEYGLPFCSAVTFDNVAAVQFHPEKSGQIGLKIYRNFVEILEAAD
jgi:glutamine amidotransferase